MSAAVAWGLAEATVFVVVPDVLITRRALRSRSHGLLAALAATAGALIGATLMYAWGGIDPHRALAVLGHLPAIGPAMIAQVTDDLHRIGVLAVFAGSFGGVPFKVYAVQAPAAGISLGWFLLASALARFTRFATSALLAWALARGLGRWLPRVAIVRIWAIGWVIGYAIYWWLTPG